MVEMRIAVRAKPGSSRTRVGGAYGPDRLLIVAVTARAVDGKANDAVVRAVAEALHVPRRTVDVVSGHTARSKVLTLQIDPTDAERLNEAVDRLRDDRAS